MKTKLGLLVISALAALTFNACGDDGGSGGNGPSNADQVVASFEDLTQCTAKREGATAYVKDEKKEYACLSGNWVPTDDAVSSVAGSSAGVSSAGVSESGRSSAASDGQSDETNPSSIGQSSSSNLAPGRDGDVRLGLNGDLLKYDSLQAQWIAANGRDTSLGLTGCTDKREGEAGVGNDDGYYICKSGQWQDASGLEYVRSAKTCSHDADLIVGSAADTNRYVCDADTFRVATDSEKGADRGCTSYNLNEERLFAGNATCSQSGIWLASTNTVPGTMTYGGQTYKTIGIGTQMWMAENLNYEYKVDGSTYGNWCYNNSADSCAKYGRLYTWAAAMDTATTGCGYATTCAASSGKVRGICPTGWHLPSAAEWSTLITAVGDSAGTKLKSTSGWYSNGNGTDAYGFSALPSGGRYSGGSFDDTGYSADFWSASGDYRDYAYPEDYRDYAYLMELYYSYAGASQYNNYKSNGFAVRCVKD